MIRPPRLWEQAAVLVAAMAATNALCRWMVQREPAFDITKACEPIALRPHSVRRFKARVVRRERDCWCGTCEPRGLRDIDQAIDADLAGYRARYGSNNPTAN